MIVIVIIVNNHSTGYESLIGRDAGSRSASSIFTAIYTFSIGGVTACFCANRCFAGGYDVSTGAFTC